MVGKFLGGGCTLALILALAGSAAGDVVNGDFEDATDFANWQEAGGGGTEVLSSYGSNSTRVAHLSVEATYTWDEFGEAWDGPFPQAAIQQGSFTSYSLEIEAGETTLEFYALAVIEGEDMSPPSATVLAAGGFAVGATVLTAHWTPYSIDLVYPGTSQQLPVGSSINVAFNVSVEAPLRFGDYGGEEVTQTIDLYLDDVHLVPLPGSGLLLLAGGVALLRRRRK